MKTYYGHGKLLISGEYYLMDGAWGLALPTQFGQRMEVEELDVPYLDTKEVLHKASKDLSINVREFYLYRYNNDHHNELGNCVIAKAIAQLLRDKIGTEIISSSPANCFD